MPLLLSLKNMNQYTKIYFESNDDEMFEFLEAEIATTENLEGIEYIDNGCIAYVPQEFDNLEEFQAIAQKYGYQTRTEALENKNWNAVWESNFEPITLEDFCYIRADFHPALETPTPYEILITPKMSFGTGHHATTQLMMQYMKTMPFEDTKVFDFGTGTGILAILAEMLGSKEILAIDNDEWCIENTIENCERNNCSKITASINDITTLDSNHYFDVILANINRHILLAYMGKIRELIAVDGILLLSGILTSDVEIITEATRANGFKLIEEQEHNGWVALKLKAI